MSELDPRHVIGHSTLLLGHGRHVRRRHVEELGFRVDEALDQPRASDPVDAGVLAGNPFHFLFLLSSKCRHV